MSDGSFSSKTRQIIRDRAKDRCEICGLHVEYGHYHHRNPRRSGGTRRIDLGLPSNGLLLHPRCHERVEQNRTNALDNGWLLYSIDNPTAYPVLLWNGWHILGEDGSVTAVPPDCLRGEASPQDEGEG